MTFARLQLAREEGQALMLVIFLIVLLTVVSVTMIDIVTSESNRSAHAVTSDASYQAAEAGISDYTAKLLDDHLYYLHYVHDGESTRLSGGTTYAPSATYTGGLTWTYPSQDNWAQLSNGYEYNLQIVGPTVNAQTVQITATGRRVGSITDTRTIQTLIRPSSVADFQMLSNASVSYGSAATTWGKIYSTKNVNHQGTAHANIYAEGSASGNPNLLDGAIVYDNNTSPTTQQMVPNGVNFSNFLTSLSDIKRASSSGGKYLDNGAADAWKLVFAADGTFTTQTCTKSSGNDVAKNAPVCAAVQGPYQVPANGAIYVEQTAIVSGVVNGRVTVASNNNIVIGDAISYAVSGDDVLGLVAKNDMVVALYTPSNLSWRAATIAQSGQWTDWCGEGGSGCGSHGTMDFTGSTATNLGGSMSMFGTRNYNYDTTLQYLQPPWFPTVEDAYTVLVSRELKP